MEDEPQEALQTTRPVAPTFKAPKQVSRPKPPVQQEEELGAEPKLGDFEDVHALSVSEARAVIHAVHDKRRKGDQSQNPLGVDRLHNDQQ
jgi:DNA-directed RNA polymerase II subunit RPB4